MKNVYFDFFLISCFPFQSAEMGNEAGRNEPMKLPDGLWREASRTAAGGTEGGGQWWVDYDQIVG